MEDTVTLARQEREKQGSWEVEVSYGGEVDLHKHLVRCQKNPGHENFIPVDQFNVEHLPPSCRDNDLVDFVRAMSDLTVRVSVKYVSDSRPETVPGRDIPFPCYKDRGRYLMRTGTGFLYGVNIYPNNGSIDTTCKCKECVNSPTPITQFAHIYILTAAHVVYDDLEAAHTTCHLFFDRGNSPDVCSTVVTLSGLSFLWCDLESDCCCMRYMTHDVELADRLNRILADYKHLSSSMEHKFSAAIPTDPPSSWSQRVVELYPLYPSTRLHPSENTESIIVSHPHGCSKQVSFGRCTRIEKREDGLTRYTYTTPTCPGSSGALVCVMDTKRLLCVRNGYVHGWGQFEGSQQLNHCSYGHYIF